MANDNMQTMKNILKSTNLPWITLACGGVGLLLQLWLLGTADEKGFVASGHISGILLWILTAGVLALLLLLTRDLQEANKFSFNFPASDVGALGSLVGALGLAVSSVAELAQWEDAVATAAAAEVKRARTRNIAVVAATQEPRITSIDTAGIITIPTSYFG